jgi:hypothetical protein
MATQADFTEQEWETMQRGLTGAGLLVSLSDRDFTDSFGEAKALSKFLAQKQKESDDPFVRAITHVHGTGFGLGTNPQELETETLAALRESVATLKAKAPGELVPYGELVITLCSVVAAAKGGVSETEQATIDKIHEAIGGPGHEA